MHPSTRALFVAALVATVLVGPGRPAPAGAGGTPVRTDAVYESTSGTGLTFVPLAARRNGDTLVKLHAEFRCEEQDVTGDARVVVGDDGKFELETTDFVSTYDVGSDTEVTVDGTFTGRAARGTIDAHVRAYDNAGTTAECDREIRWRARATAAPVLERFEGFVPLGDADWLAAAEDAVYVGEGDGIAATRLRRIDPETGDEVWSKRVDSLEELAAGPASVWGADAGDGFVRGYAAADGEPVSELEIPGDYDGIGTTADSPIAVTSDAVWVGLTPGRVLRLDPRTGDVVAELEVGGGPDAHLSLAANDDAVVVAIEAPSESGAAIVIDLVRIDVTTNEVVAEGDTTGQVEALAIAGDTVTVPRFDDSTVRFDLESLDELGDVDELAFDAVGRGDETWLATEAGLVVLDETGDVVLELPAVTGQLALAGDVVLVLDDGAGGFLRLGSGGRADV